MAIPTTSVSMHSLAHFSHLSGSSVSQLHTPKQNTILTLIDEKTLTVYDWNPNHTKYKNTKSLWLPI